MDRSTRARPRTSRVVAVVCALAVLVPLPAAASPFDDVEGDVHTDAIAIVAETGITRGCREGEFCPADPVRRDQMARFLQRTLRLSGAEHAFTDVPRTGSLAGAVGAIAAHEPPITRGCGPDRFCPAGHVTRGQMASFLTAAFALPAGDHGFDDVPDDHPHADGIRAVAAAGLTRGCAQTRFCPDRDVRRDQMASLLAAAVGLHEPVGCPALDTGPDAGPDLERMGIAAPGYPVTTALPTAEGLLVFPNDLGEEARITRLVAGQVTETIPVAAGRRTWAAVETGRGTFYGQVGVDGGQPNLFPLGDDQGVAIPAGRQLWTLTAAPDDRIYAGSRGHLRLADPDANLVHRYDPATGELAELVFDLPQDRHLGGTVPREDVKQLAWDEGVLVAGTGFGPGTARLSLIDLSSEDVDPPAEPNDPDGGDPDGADPDGDGPGDEPPPPDEFGDSDETDPLDEAKTTTRRVTARDITPRSILAARTVFSLAVSDGRIALGTWAGGDEDDPDARLVVLDRHDPTGPPLVDVRLPDEVRVDQVAIDGDRVAAVGFPSGRPVLVEAGVEADTDRPRALPAPVPGTATRSLELDGTELRGVASPGRVWTMDTERQTRSVQDLATGQVPGVPVGQQTTHSLATSARDVLVGANGEVHLHPSDGDPERRSVRVVPGETKAIATAGDDAYLATYPAAQLWKVSGADPSWQLAADPVTDLDPRYNRPRALAHDPDTGHVAVVAREDGTGQPRPSQLTLIDPDVADGSRSLDRVPLRAVGDPERDVEGLTAVAQDGLVVVGDRSGGVRAYATEGDRLELRWQVRPRLVDRPVVALTWEPGGRVVGTLGAGAGWFELDPTTGELVTLGRSALRGQGGTHDAVQLGPVSVVTNVEHEGEPGEHRELVAVERGHDRSSPLLLHLRGETFRGPPTAVDADCRLHVIIGRDLLRLPYDARSRLP